MQSSQSPFNHTFYPHPIHQDHSLTSNKINRNDHLKLKTQTIEPYQSYKLKNYLTLEKSPSSLQLETNSSPKQYTFKPLRNISNNPTIKLKTELFQNQTVNPPSTNLYPDLTIKRSGSTAPIRNRAASQTNKENLPNQEEKLTPECQNKKPLESVSSIFHYTNKTKHLRISSLVRLKSKPHIIFYSSKLPKDFFGDSLDEDHHGFQYRFVPVNLKESQSLNASKKLKYTSSLKTLNQAKDCESAIKLCLNEKKTEQKSKLNTKTQPEFTFRKQKSRKQLETFEENTLIQTPNFVSQVQKTQPLKEQNTPQRTLIKAGTLSEPNKRQYRKYSRQFLKL